MEPPNLEDAVDTPDLDEDNDEGEGPAFLISYNDGALETVYLSDTDDEKVSSDDLVERFSNALKKGNPFFRLGRRQLRIDLIRSFGPEDEVDYPEVSIFSSIEDRVERLLKGAEHTVNMVSQQAQAMSFLTDQQGSLQQAQAELFNSFDVEASLDEDEEVSVPGVPLPRPKRPAKTGGAGLRTLKMPGVKAPKPPGQ